MAVKRITLDDLPACFDIARESYAGHPFDERAMWAWAVKAINTPTVIAIRDDDAFGLAEATGLPWLPREIHGAQLYLAMRKKAVWQGLRIARIMRDWCFVNGAVDYQFGEATGMRMDVFAKRLGAVPNRPTYVCSKETLNAAAASSHPRDPRRSGTWT
jgi:hypothetical protein